MISRCGIIVLAAGSSGRLGQPKQLLPYKGKILLQYLLDEATASAASAILVVLGAEAENIKAKLSTTVTQRHRETRSILCDTPCTPCLWVQVF